MKTGLCKFIMGFSMYGTTLAKIPLFWEITTLAACSILVIYLVLCILASTNVVQCTEKHCIIFCLFCQAMSANKVPPYAYFAFWLVILIYLEISDYILNNICNSMNHHIYLFCRLTKCSQNLYYIFGVSNTFLKFGIR